MRDWVEMESSLMAVSVYCLLKFKSIDLDTEEYMMISPTIKATSIAPIMNIAITGNLNDLIVLLSVDCITSIL
jgi:hypothetical protein